MVSWTPHSDRLNKKRIQNFVGDIQTMIDKNPNKSIRSITRDNENVCVSYQAGSA